MDVSAQTLREVEFREKLRGYHPDDVDEFLERVAAGIEFLQERLREATERAVRAEQRIADGSEGDDALRRTLVLAQRTAELAVQEAREEAARIESDAKAEARAIVGKAEEVARRTIDEAQGGLRAELTQLETARDHLRTDITALERHLEQERANLRARLSEALAMVDAVVPPDVPAPSLHAIEIPPLRVPTAPELSSLDEVDEELSFLDEVDEEEVAGESVVIPPPPPLPSVAKEAPESPWAPEFEGDEMVSAAEPTPEAEPEPVAVAAADVGEAVDFGEDDDPFIAELRRAITDPEPLGPREEDDATAEAHDSHLHHDDVLEGSRLGSLLRRTR